jgi:DnaJ-class molecular chaperone
MNPYEILDIPVSASEMEIKKAYRSACQKHHPDKGGDTHRFTQIQKAYDILSNEVRRRIYDSSGYTEEIRTPDIESQMASLFGGVIEGGNYQGDIVARCLEAVKMQGHETRREILVVNAKKMQFNEQIGRIENDIGSSMFDQILKQKIGEIDTVLISLEAQKISCMEMEAVLKQYRDNKARPFTSATGYTTGTGSSWTG